MIFTFIRTLDQKEALGLGIIVRVIFLMIAVASGTFREGRFGAVVVVVIKGGLVFFSFWVLLGSKSPTITAFSLFLSVCVAAARKLVMAPSSSATSNGGGFERAAADRFTRPVFKNPLLGSSKS